MDVTFDFDETVAFVTGAGGTLGGTIARTLHEADASIAATGVAEPSDEGDFFETRGMWFYEGDFTDEDDVARVVDEVISGFGHLDHLINIAGTWHGGTPIGKTDADTLDFLFDVNLKTTFLVSGHAIPRPRKTEGFVMSISVHSSLKSGEGDSIYRTSKASVRLLTETIAERNHDDVRADTVMPSVIDTPMNREMMADADFDSWVKSAGIARTVLALCSDATPATSGAAVPVCGEA